jgi:AcrR family transcriptional regulator
MSKGEETRHAILIRAAQLASEIGLEALSIGRLAREVGLSKSGLFAHFGSKEKLQREVVDFLVGFYQEEVVRPAFRAPRGEPRIRLLLENWLQWSNSYFGGGCPFVQMSAEYDDRPGPIRDFLSQTQREWLAGTAKSARLAMDEGHFRSDLDPEQFAFEFFALLLGYHHGARLIRDPHAEKHVRAAFEDLIIRSRKV